MATQSHRQAHYHRRVAAKTMDRYLCVHLCVCECVFGPDILVFGARTRNMQRKWGPFQFRFMARDCHSSLFIQPSLFLFLSLSVLLYPLSPSLSLYLFLLLPSYIILCVLFESVAKNWTTEISVEVPMRMGIEIFMIKKLYNIDITISILISLRTNEYTWLATEFDIWPYYPYLMYNNWPHGYCLYRVSCYNCNYPFDLRVSANVPAACPCHNNYRLPLNRGFVLWPFPGKCASNKKETRKVNWKICHMQI